VPHSGFVPQAPTAAAASAGFVAAAAAAAVLASYCRLVLHWLVSVCTVPERAGPAEPPWPDGAAHRRQRGQRGHGGVVAGAWSQSAPS
jgi:hypothetical protein